MIRGDHFHAHQLHALTRLRKDSRQIHGATTRAEARTNFEAFTRRRKRRSSTLPHAFVTSSATSKVLPGTNLHSTVHSFFSGNMIDTIIDTASTPATTPSVTRVGTRK